MPSLVNAMNHRMDYLVQRQGVISGNVANANTPNYISKDIGFEAYLQGSPGMAMAQTDKGHMGGGRAASNFKMTEDRTFMRHDGNSVKLDEEMFKLNQTRMNYDTVVQLYAKQKQFQQLAVQNSGQ